jgi:transcriptional regulator with XRE-family HTH domain
MLAGKPQAASCDELGDAIRRRREMRGLSRAELARLAGIDRSHLARVESGRTQLGWTRLGRIAHTLQLRVATLARDAELGTVSVAHQASRGGAVPNPPSAAALGGAVRRLRRAKRTSIEALALRVGLHPTSVDKIERAQRQPIWPTLCELAAALELEVSALVEAAEREQEEAGQAVAPGGH